MGVTRGDGPTGPGAWPAAFRGGLGFLTRLPVGRSERDWAAFRAAPVAFPLVGYVAGALVALPFALARPVPLPEPTVAAAFLVWLYAVTGLNHVDGLADLGDAVAVHGDAGRRLAALKDTTTGVGALLAVGLVLAGLALAGLALAGRAILPVAGLVVAAEVGTKLGMAALACLGTAATGGMGAELTERAGPRALALPVAVALPAATLAWPSPASAVALTAPLAVALAVWRWADRALDGVNGDVLGAANELGRVAGLHAGVVAWTLS